MLFIIDLVFGGTKRAKFASPPLTSPWIYIIYFVFGGTKILHYVIFYLVFGGTKSAQFASGTSSITMNIFLHYVIFYLVFGGTKRAQFASPPLTSPWIYILRIRWHQNLTLCYFLFSIRWHQKGSVCFSPSNITMNIYLTLCYFLFHIRWPKSYIMLFFISYS